MKFFVASFNRASDGAITKIVEKLKKEDMWTYDPQQSDYIIAVGDRCETFDFCLKWFRKGKPIIHLWAGEISQGTEDEVYRWALTHMSILQLSTNYEAKYAVKNFCDAVGKKYNVHTIGNVMLDNMEIDESIVPKKPYNLILYNPPTLYTEEEVTEELKIIDEKTKGKKRIWISPNGDKHSNLILPYVNTDNLPRPQFLGLIKNCDKFISNSSCSYYEAPFLMKEENIIIIGERNKDRNSKTDMNIPNASDNIIKILKENLK